MTFVGWALQALAHARRCLVMFRRVGSGRLRPLRFCSTRKQVFKRAWNVRSTNSVAENELPTSRAKAPRYRLHRNHCRLKGGNYGAWSTTRMMKVTCTSSTDTTTNLCAGMLQMMRPHNLLGVMTQVHWSFCACLPANHKHSFLLRVSGLQSAPDRPAVASFWQDLPTAKARTLASTGVST